MAILYSGTEGTCAWTIDDQGHLYIGDGVISHSTDISTDWGWYSYRTNIINVTTGQISWALNANTCNMFNGCTNLVSLDASNFDTSNVTDMYAMFWNCNSLTSLDLSNFDTSKVTDMSRMFNSCYALASIDLSSFDTSNVTDMNNMFYGCRSLTSLNLSSFDTSNVTDMNYMFCSCQSLTVLNLSNLDMSNVTNMKNMFWHCISLTSLNLSNTNTSQVTNMYNMFNCCRSLTSLDLSSFNTSQVKDMCGMFDECSALTLLNLSSFNTSQVKDMDSMFAGCSSLIALDLSNFNTSNVVYMNNMFNNCSSLTTLNLSSFNTSNVEEMDYMFSKCTSLTGNIYVMGRPDSYSGIFTDTTQPIYIIQNTSSPNSQTTSYWKNIANIYSNVHYEAVDHINYPSTITGEVSRVDDDGNLSNEGTNAKIELRTTQSDQFVPQNVIGPAASRLTNTLIITITMDENSPISGNNGSNIINLITLPFGAHTFVCTVTDINTTSSITLTLSQARALLDFLGKGSQGGYIDKPGMGIAIGKFASRNGLDIQFPTTIGEELLPATQPVDPTLTNDSTVNSNKNYYTYDLITDKYYLIEEPNAETNPQNEGWYEAENQAVDLNNYQLIIGKYNKQNDDAIFIIGNGTTDNTRSNLMLIGNHEIQIGNDTSAHLRLEDNGITGLNLNGTNYFSITEDGGQETKTTYTIIWESAGSPTQGSTESRTFNLTSRMSKWSTLPNTTAFSIRVTYVYRIPSSTGVTYKRSTKKMNFIKNQSKTSDAFIRYSTTNGGEVTITSKEPGTYSSTYYRGYINVEFILTTNTTGALYRFGNEVAETGGPNAFLMGTGTKANSANQLAIGSYNIPETSALFMIGNGDDDDNRSNACTIDQYGSLTLAGSIKTNRDVETASSYAYINSGDTGQYLNLCSVVLTPNSKFLVLSTVKSDRGTSLTLLNSFTFTNSPTVYGNATRVYSGGGQGVANWAYVITGDDASVCTLQGYSYEDGGDSYNQYGYMIAIPL